MTTRILVGTFQVKKQSRPGAVLYDDSSMVAFGPILTADSIATLEEARELAEGFKEFVEEKVGRGANLVPTPRLHNHFIAYLEELATKSEDEDNDSDDNQKETA